MSTVQSLSSSTVLQICDSVMVGVTWTYMGSSMDSLTGSEATIPAKASACRLAILGIFLMTHYSSCSNDSCTFSRYLAMHSSLVLYFFRMCPTMI